jgi:hypothetical protein
MHHDTQPFRTLQNDAKRTADQLTAFIDQAITTNVYPPRLLADAAWELWEFARLATPPEPDGQRWPETLEPSAGVRDMERRRFLAGVVASAGAVVSESAVSPPSTATLARLQATTERFRQARVADATRGYLGPMLRHAQALDLAANRAHAALRRDLLVAHGDALTILAWFANEDGRAALARKLTTDALAAASEAGHHELAAYSYGMLALFHAHHLGDPHESLRLVGAGMDHAKNATGTTRAWLASVQGEAHSMLGNRARTMAALDRAYARIDRASEALPWLAPEQFGSAIVQGFWDVCATRVGRPREGASVLQAVLDQFDVEHSHRAVILADLAAAYAGQKEPERACTAASHALDIVADRKSAMKLERVASARAWLEPWRGERFVQELDEQLTAVAATL